MAQTSQSFCHQRRFSQEIQCTVAPRSRRLGQSLQNSEENLQERSKAKGLCSESDKQERLDKHKLARITCKGDQTLTIHGPL
jgi:hypothetical protein